MTICFSIIIPVYNVAPYLHDCLDSVLSQTFADWEAICVDDGSTDGSGDILDEYVAKDGRIKVIHQNNAGASAARNTGLRLAVGEWLCFIDGDDYVDANYLSSFFAVKHKADVNFIDCVAFNNSGCLAKYDSLHCPIMPVDGDGEWVLMERACGAQGDTFGWTFNKTINRSVAQGVLFNEKVTCFEDELYALELFENARTFQMLDICPYHYRCRNDSLTFGRKHDKRVIASSFSELAARAKVPFVKKLATIRSSVEGSKNSRKSLRHYWATFKQSNKLHDRRFVREYRLQLVKTYLKNDCAFFRPLVFISRSALKAVRGFWRKIK